MGIEDFRQLEHSEILKLFKKRLQEFTGEAEINVSCGSWASCLGIRISAISKADKEGRTGYLEFSLVELPGCCMYLVSTSTLITGRWRGKGLSYLLQEIKTQIAQEYGYTKLFCTVTAHNEPEIRVLKKCGWKKIEEETNKRTKNVVQMYTIKV